MAGEGSYRLPVYAVEGGRGRWPVTNLLPVTSLLPVTNLLPAGRWPVTNLLPVIHGGTNLARR